jgi:hypothetical protein
MFIGGTAFVIFWLCLEVDSPGDRLLQVATRHISGLISRSAQTALDFLIANI